MLQAVKASKKVKGVVLEVSSGGKYRIASYFVNRFGNYVCQILEDDVNLFECYDENFELSNMQLEKFLRKKIPYLPRKIYVDELILFS